MRGDLRETPMKIGLGDRDYRATKAGKKSAWLHLGLLRPRDPRQCSSVGLATSLG